MGAQGCSGRDAGHRHDHVAREVHDRGLGSRAGHLLERQDRPCDDDGCYRLGSKVLYLGSLYQRHFRTSELVPPVLRRLVDEIHEGASFYIFKVIGPGQYELQ